MITFVGLAHSREIEYQRTVLSVLSLYAWTENADKKIRFLIYTDNEEYFAPYFKGLNVLFVKITQNILNEWKGAYNYIHRVKIKIIQDAFAKYPSDGILYLDSDTFWYEDASAVLNVIHGNNTVMYAREYTFEQNSASGSVNTIEFMEMIDNKNVVVNDQSLRFSKNNYSWNAGVLGIGPQNSELVNLVLGLSDYLYEKKNIFTVEQYSFSLLFQTRTNLHDSINSLCHYFSKKNAIDVYVLKFLEEVRGIDDIVDMVEYTKRFTRNLQEGVRNNPKWEDQPILMDRVKLFIKYRGDWRIFKNILSIIKRRLIS